MAKTNDGKDVEVIDQTSTFSDEYSRSEDFVAKNKNLLLYILAGIILIGAGILAYKAYQQKQDDQAQAELFPAVYYFEADSLNKALKGDSKNPGLLDIKDEYSGTDAANLSNFYIGVSYLKKGQYDDAIEYLKDFNSSDYLIQARAYALIGDANMELKKYDEAAEQYKKAADYKSNEFFSPQYIMKEALAYERSQNYQGAIEAYNRIIENYSTSVQINDAKKYKARAEALAVK